MALRGANSNFGTTSTTSGSITYSGTSIAVGDLIVLITQLTTGSGATFTDPSGFTPGSSLSPAIADVYPNGSDHLHVAVKIAVSGDIGTPTYASSSSSAGYWKQTLRVYSGRVNSSVSAAFNNQGATAAGAGGTLPNVYTLTGLTALAGDDVIAVVATAYPSQNNNVPGITASATSFANAQSAYYSTYGYGGALLSLDHVGVSAGSTGSIAVTVTNTSGSAPADVPQGFVMSLPATSSGAVLVSAAADTTAATGALTTGIKLASITTDATAATGALTTAIKLAAATTNTTSATGALQAAAALASAATNATAATAAFTTFASVTLINPLYTGIGGILDPDLTWPFTAPGNGSVVYYDPTVLTVLTNAETAWTTDNASAVIEYFDGTNWNVVTLVITPLMVGYLFDTTAATGNLTAPQMAALVGAALTFTSSTASLTAPQTAVLVSAAVSLTLATGSLDGHRAGRVFVIKDGNKYHTFRSWDAAKAALDQKNKELADKKKPPKRFRRRKRWPTKQPNTLKS